MSTSRTLFFPVILSFFLLSCGKRNSFVSRNYHELTSSYNVLFNGENYLQTGKTLLVSGFREDIWEPITVEPVLVQDSLLNKNPMSDLAKESFLKAEDKAIKTVQKHSIIEYGGEQNKEIDKAYLLLGKARYYDARYAPALEAFNFAIRQNPGADLLLELKVWRAKTMLRLQNEDQAIAILQQVILSSKLEDQLKFQVYTSLSQAYMELGDIEKAKVFLKLSQKTGDLKEQQDRNQFLLGQILYFQDSLSLAVNAFEDLALDRKKTKKYQSLSLVYLTSPEIASLDSLQNQVYIKRLDQCLNNQYYKANFAYLAFASGQINQDSVKYVFSSVHSSADSYVRERSLNNLGDMAFDKGEILLAGVYYDSILREHKTLDSRYLLQLNRKYSSMLPLVNYEKSRSEIDSLNRLWSMDQEDRFDYFMEEASKQNPANTAVVDLNQVTGGSWYFANPSLVKSGLASFQNQWGNIADQDNWKYENSSSKRLSSEENLELSRREAIVLRAAVYEEQFKPKTDYNLDSIQLVYREATLQSGILYQDRFEKNALAEERFLSLNTAELDSETKLILDYRLYLLYKEANQEDKAQGYLSRLKTEYPDHPYTKLAQGIRFETDNENWTPQEIYQQIYYDYQASCYEEALDQLNRELPKLGDKEIIPKFELLRALVLLKTDNKTLGSDALQRLVDLYPSSEEAEYAEELLKLNTPK